MRNVINRLPALFLIAAAAHAQSFPQFAQPTASSSRPSVTVAESEVRIEGMTPGGSVLLYSSALTTVDGMTVERTAARTLADPDRDGIFRFEAMIPLRSVWIAVDLGTGKYAVSGRAGFTLRSLIFPRSVLKEDLEGIIGIADYEQLAADAVIVRPGKGAWRIRAFEGGNGDADQTRNGKLTLPADAATPIDGTDEPAPKRLKPGDILAVIEPMRLEVFVGEITK